VVETHIAEVDLESLKERLRDELRRMSGIEVHGPHAPPDHLPSGDPPPADPAPADAAPGDERSLEPTLPSVEARNESSPLKPLQVSYREIAQENGHRFLEKAYQSLLHRSADQAGGAFYMEALRSGKMSKAEVMAYLRFSPEGRARRVRLSGLWGPLLRAALRKIPVLGRMFPSADQVQTWIAEESHAMRLFVEEHMARAAEERHAMQRCLEDHVAGAVEAFRREWTGFLREVVLPRLEALEGQTEAMENRTLGALNALNERLDTLQNDNLNALNALSERFNALQNDNLNALNALNERLDTLQNDNLNALNALKSLDERLQTLMVKDLPGHLREHAQAIALLRQAVADQQRLAWRQLWAEDAAAPMAPDSAPVSPSDENARGKTLYTSPSPPLDAHGSTRIGAAPAGAAFDSHLDALYTSLEDAFRGTFEAIQERLRFYLPYVRAVPLDLAPVPLVDAGCGRGEWLHLLRDEGIVAVGVDTNPIMVARCREQGLHVLHGDAVSYLRSLAPGSVGAITAFQLIEHLDLIDLVAFLDAAYESLVPGGMILCETPNPENLLVSTYYFHFDPTHRRPIPPPVARFLLESRGFACVQVVRPSGSGGEVPSDAATLPPLLQKALFAPADYAVIARKAPCDHSL